MREDLSSFSARVPATILFNKHNGELLFVVKGSREEYGEVDEESFIARWADYDFMRDKVIGELLIDEDGNVTDNWSVVDQDDAPAMVLEKNLNRMAEQKITKKYPIAEQISIVARVVAKIADKVGVEAEDLEEMLSYMQLCFETNAAQKEFYRGNPDVEYISDEEAAERNTRKLAGGIHEKLGARPVTDGRVFGSDQ